MTKQKSKIEAFWKNPPDGSATIQLTIGKRVYVREVNKKSVVDTVEASKLLGVSLVHIHRLIKMGMLKPIYRQDSVLIKMKDIVRYRETRRPPGRPPTKEPFLVG